MSGVTPEGDITVVVDRDSVAMGDDVNPHREYWVLPASATVDDLLVAMARGYLPPVGAWRVEQDYGDTKPRWFLGMIYQGKRTQHSEPFVCRANDYPLTLQILARRVPMLSVEAVYLSGAASRPVWLSEVEATPSRTGATPTKLESEAQKYAQRDWRVYRRLETLSRAAAAARQSWIRHNILSHTAMPADAEVFAARNLQLLTDDLCPASLTLAAKLLGMEGKNEEAFADLAPERATLGIFATTIAGFEWALSNYFARSHVVDPRTKALAYLEYLGAHGYQFATIERYMIGQISFQELAALEDATTSDDPS